MLSIARLPLPTLRVMSLVVFNLVEGIDVKEMQAKVEAYRRANADNIAHNEARLAEELRRGAAADAEAGHPEGLERAGVSGTAAAFHGGKDGEPHQGMEYTAAIPSGLAT